MSWKTATWKKTKRELYRHGRSEKDMEKVEEEYESEEEEWVESGVPEKKRRYMGDQKEKTLILKQGRRWNKDFDAERRAEETIGGKNFFFAETEKKEV